ncbi:MAG: phosphoribosylglycinamide formyltransferase [Spirochaetae bacterium HGW-Spirochaetae-5]|nr:MAG: phosphoribosylglycinamide formyltransferase [Spirochaetae bacterium HGW-Spirochaetae-5]
MIFIKKKKKVISFLVSGNGSNFKAVAEKIKNGYINGKTGIVISTSQDAPALKKSEELGIPSVIIDHKHFASKKDYEAEMIKILKDFKTDLIITAGYMRILSPDFIMHFQNRIINIHPSLLPSFPGKSAQQQALDYGVKITGCTSHFIDEGTDTGPVIMQAPVSVDYEDNINTLSAKILSEEHRILADSVKLFCEDRLIIKNRRVKIKK